MAFFSAIGAAVFGAGTFLAAAATVVLKLAVGIGLNLLAQSLAGKPKGPEFSINGSIQGGGDLPRSIMFGEYSTAGSLVWANTWGNDGDTKNAYLTQVIAVSDMPVKGYLSPWVNGEKVTVGADGTYGKIINEYRNDGSPRLWMKFYDGTQTTADPLLTGRASNANRQWGANRVGKGVAYVIVTALITKNMFSGMPTFKFEVDGARLYDPSRDSTVGGAGLQRLADPSTWGGDGDYLPAVQMYNILMGIKYNGRWLYGFQDVSQARLPSDNWITQINKCRQLIDSSGGPQPQYRSGMETPVDVATSGAFEALLSACQGRISDVGGMLYLHCGEPEAPLVSFTDGDIIVTNGQSFTPFFGLADSINGISAKWPSREDGWNIKTAPPLYRADLEAKHGNRRLMADVELVAVPYAEQVQRLMRSSLLEAQRARRHTISLPPAFWVYCVPGATISWTSERNGYVNKLFRIDGVVDGANLEVMIDITEVDPSDYNWDSATDYTPPVDGALGPMRPAPMPIIGFGALPDVAQDSNGNNRRCAIRLFWDGSLNGVDFVDYEVRLASTLAVIDTGRATEFERAAVLIAPGTLLPNEDYQVRGIYGTYDGNSPFEWSSWLPVKTLDIRFGPLDIYPIDIEAVNDDLKESWKWSNDAIRYLGEEQDRIGKVVSDITVGAFTDRQVIRTELTSTAAGITASYTEDIIAATGPGSALVARIETLEVTVGEDIATAVATLTTQINDVDGRVDINSAAITALTAELADKADASALQTLSVTVTEQGDDIIAQGSAITSLTATVSDKAEASAVNALTVIVNQQGDDITAVSNSITGLTSTVGNFSASGLFRTTVEATPTGALSRIGLTVAATDSSVASEAAIFLDAIAGGDSRVVINADQFIVTNGVDSLSPMTFINGELTARFLNIGTAFFDELHSRNGKLKLRGYDDLSDIRMFS